MVVEILGTRIIGPVFGVSLFVWTALLTVTLASLAAGYYIGGVLADRSPTALLLGAATVAAGMAIGITPVFISEGLCSVLPRAWGPESVRLSALRSCSDLALQSSDPSALSRSAYRSPTFRPPDIEWVASMLCRP
jgi:hypothetical protein